MSILTTFHIYNETAENTAKVLAWNIQKLNKEPYLYDAQFSRIIQTKKV